MTSARVCVIGSGYVGLTTAACMAHLGHDVVCSDVDADRVARLNAVPGSGARSSARRSHAGSIDKRS